MKNSWPIGRSFMVSWVVSPARTANGTELTKPLPCSMSSSGYSLLRSKGSSRPRNMHTTSWSRVLVICPVTVFPAVVKAAVTDVSAAAAGVAAAKLRGNAAAVVSSAFVVLRMRAVFLMVPFPTVRFSCCHMQR